MYQFPEYDEHLAELDLQANTNEVSASVPEVVAGPLSSASMGDPVVNSPRNVNTAQLFACADEEAIFKCLSPEEKCSYISIFMRCIDHMIFECAGTVQQKLMLNDGAEGELAFFRLKGLQIMVARIWLEDNVPDGEVENINVMLQQWTIEDGIKRIKISQGRQPPGIQQKSLIDNEGECSRFLTEFQERAARKMRTEEDSDNRDIGLLSAVYQVHILQESDSTWHVIPQSVLIIPQQISIRGQNVVPITRPVSPSFFLSKSEKAAEVEPTMQKISARENSGVPYAPREVTKMLEGSTDALIMTLLDSHIGRTSKMKRRASGSPVIYDVEGVRGASPCPVAQWIENQPCSTNGPEASGQPASWDSYGISPLTKDPPESILARKDRLLLLKPYQLGKAGLDVIHEIEDIFLKLKQEGRMPSAQQRQEMDAKLGKLEDRTNTPGARSSADRLILYEGSMFRLEQALRNELEQQQALSPSSADGTSRASSAVQGSSSSDFSPNKSEDMAQTKDAAQQELNQQENMFMPEVPGLESMEID